MIGGRNYFVTGVALISISFYFLASTAKAINVEAINFDDTFFSSKIYSLKFIKNFQLNLDEKLIQIFKNFWFSIKEFFGKIIQSSQDAFYGDKKEIELDLDNPISLLSFLGEIFKKIYSAVNILFAPIITLGALILKELFLFLVKILKILVEIIFSFTKNF